MAKGFSPLIGLAVVVALAMAAVFGAMSLANPAMAQDDPPDIENLAVTNVTADSVTLEWDFIEDYTVDDFRATWSRMLAGNTQVSDPVDSGSSGAFTVSSLGAAATSSAAAMKATATITSASGSPAGGLAFTVGDEFTINVQTSKDTTRGAFASVMATPAATPGTAAVTEVMAVSGMPGSVALEWTYAAANGVDADDVTGWEYRTAEYEEPDPATPTDVTDNTLKANSQSEWMPLSGVTGEEGTAADPFMATVSGLGSKVFRFQVQAMNGQAVDATVADIAGAAVVADTVMVEENLAPVQLTGLDAEPGNGRLTVTWRTPRGNDLQDITYYQWRHIETPADESVPADGDAGWSDWDRLFSTDNTLDDNLINQVTIFGLNNKQSYTVQVRAVRVVPAGETGAGTHFGPASTTTGTPDIIFLPVVKNLPYFVQSSDDPGDSGNYDVKFQINPMLSDAINTRNDDLIIEFHEDYGIPSTMRNTSVAVTTKLGNDDEVTFTPEDVTVDGEKILISLGDMDERDDRFDYEIDPGEVINVHFRQSAGITTATEDGGYFLVEIVFGAYDVAYNEDTEMPDGLEVNIYRKLSLSEEDGGLGDVIEATGKGYKNGTTLTVFDDSLTEVMWDNTDDDVVNMVRLPANMVAQYDARIAAGLAMDPPVNYGNIPMGDIPTEDDKNALHTYTVEPSTVKYALAPNRQLDLGEDVLCVANIGGNDIGKCEFTVSHPVFSGGLNYVNAVDGRDQYARNPDTFILEASIEARPASGSPGESIVIQIVDFPPNRAISDIQISRDDRHINCVGNCSTDQNGAASFSIIIPNWVKAGTQDLRVTVQDASGSNVRAGTTVDLAGPRIVSTPQTVVANQRVSLVGTGFSPNAELGDDTDRSRAISKVSIGGYTIPWAKINDGRNVNVDDSGNWSSSLDLPLVEATTGTGERLLRVTDSGGRTGAIILNLAERDFNITPPSGRVGTLAVVRGVGYPGKNDEGDSFTIDVTYKVQEGTETRVSVLPDASGRFEVQLRIPTTAPIPSTNQVEVTFEHEVGGTKVTDVKQHSIPEGLVTTSVTSGGPGSTVTLSGEGFKTFSPVESVKIGAIEITPSPRPHTDANGMMSFDILIPGLDVGIQTIEVRVGGTTSSTGFTVTESGINPGDIVEVAVGLEDLGENFVNIWHFNNDTKSWSFYDGEDGSDLTHLITGETYLLQITSTTEVILNRDTRSLTCVGGNCWNQIVW